MAKSQAEMAALIDTSAQKRMLSIQDIVKKIDQYAGKMVLGGHKTMHDSTDTYVAGMINDLNHEDNGNGSELHPLSCLHFTTGAADHFTIQAGWIQTVCLRQMRFTGDDGLQIVAYGIKNATKKQEVKAAHQSAFGHAIQSIDNLHFYAQGGGVETCAPNLGVAWQLIRNAMANAGQTGARMVEKDETFLGGREENLDNFALKLAEQPAWLRLKRLLEVLAAGPMHAEKAVRHRRANYLLDALTRTPGPQPG
ncbi:MAG: hypothetical protein OEU36_24010 [Gammaproteobacteria bacterium]|nr:hypothetical protein [Gammaproteobacteria bacterium]